MNYLTDHGLVEYTALEEKASLATSRHRELSDLIKSAEKRIVGDFLLRRSVMNHSCCGERRKG